MAKANFHVGDVGSSLEFWLESLQADGSFAKDDLTGKTVMIRVTRPDGSATTWTATPDPDQATNRGKATYTFASGDLSLPGNWTVQPVATAIGYQRGYEPKTFYVLP
jgi:hypothetical protein